MSRRLRYQVAASLDGFIAGPKGESDWIVVDPAIDFGKLFSQFDTAVMGRTTYEAIQALGGTEAMPGMEWIVFSSTLASSSKGRVRIVNDDAALVVSALKAQPGRDIWLFGGGKLFRSLLNAGLVDSVELAIVPVLLGSGTPLVIEGARQELILADCKALSNSGIVIASYRVPGGSGAAPAISYIG